LRIHKNKITTRASPHANRPRRKRLRERIVPLVLTLIASAIWSPIAVSEFVCTTTQITSSIGGANFGPSINAAGTRIAFISTSDLTGGNADGNNEIFLFDANAPAPSITQITNSTGGGLTTNWEPSINADGTRITFSSERDLCRRRPPGNRRFLPSVYPIAAGTPGTRSCGAVSCWKLPVNNKREIPSSG